MVPSAQVSGGVMKNFLVLIVLVACAGAGYYYLTEGKTTTPAAAVPAVAAKPIDKMRAICESHGMKLQAFMDGGGGNLTFVIRSPKDNQRKPQEAVDAAIAAGIIRSSDFVSSANQSDTFNGDITDSTYTGVLIP